MPRKPNSSRSLKNKSAVKPKLPVRKKFLKAKSVNAEIIPSDQTTHDSGNSLVSSDPLVMYLNEIRKYPLLTKEDEKKLAIQYHKTKDPLAAEKLVTSNLRFVVKVAVEYAKFNVKLMDLIQEGNVGLIHAVKEFNPYKGVRLITYAVWWIRGYIRDYLLKQHSMVRIGTTRNQKKLFYQLQKEQQKIESLGESAPVALLSSRLNVSEDDVRLMTQRMKNRDLSLDQPLDDESSSHLVDMQTSSEESPDVTLEMQELVDLLKQKIEEIRPELNEKELAILEERILSDEPKTLQEIGDRFGITRERARQIEEKLISNLREKF